MDQLLVFVAYAAVLVAVSMAGALLPRAKKLDEENACRLVALSTGIFIGLLFTMLLPQAFEECGHGSFGAHGAALAVMAGFILVFFIDFFLDRGEPHHHGMDSLSSMAGLSVHAVCDGMALAATFIAGEEVGLMATAGMCIHKFVVLFSLSSSMLLSDPDAKRSAKKLLGFSLVTPAAGIVFMLFFSGLDFDQYTGIPLAFAAGTFMFVALAHMLPDAMEDRGNWKTAALIAAGIALMASVAFAFPHAH